jgi:hypothetical protein
VRPLSALLALALATSAARADPPPALVLWAWERPEDLRFAPADVGVAYLRATVDLRPTGVRVAPRRQPLRTREGAYLVAVVRVEARPRATGLNPAARARVVEQLVEAARSPGVRAVQVDFDAGASQREDYRALLAEARRALPAGTWFSMTALASWCEGDAWIDAAAPPVDEVVPMVFAMGRGGAAVLGALRSRGRFRSAACGASVGWSAGEPTVALRGVRRRYVFNPRAWTAAALRAVRRSGQRVSR